MLGIPQGIYNFLLFVTVHTEVAPTFPSLWASSFNRRMLDIQPHSTGYGRFWSTLWNVFWLGAESSWNSSKCIFNLRMAKIRLCAGPSNLRFAVCSSKAFQSSSKIHMFLVSINRNKYCCKRSVQFSNCHIGGSFSSASLRKMFNLAIWSRHFRGIIHSFGNRGG